LSSMWNKRKLLVQIIKSEIECDRLTDLLADEYIQQTAQELKESVESAESGKNGR
jgi:hypothetical protein